MAKDKTRFIHITFSDFLDEYRTLMGSVMVPSTVCDFSPWASSAMEAVKEMKFDTKVA